MKQPRTNPPSKVNPPYEYFVMRTHNSLLRSPRRRHNPYPITIYEADTTDTVIESMIVGFIICVCVLAILVTVYVYF